MSKEIYLPGDIVQIVAPFCTSDKYQKGDYGIIKKVPYYLSGLYEVEFDNKNIGYVFVREMELVHRKELNLDWKRDTQHAIGVDMVDKKYKIGDMIKIINPLVSSYKKDYKGIIVRKLSERVFEVVFKDEIIHTVHINEIQLEKSFNPTEQREDIVVMVKEALDHMNDVINPLGGEKHGWSSWKDKDNLSLQKEKNYKSILGHVVSGFINPLNSADKGADHRLQAAWRLMIDYVRDVRGYNK